MFYKTELLQHEQPFFPEIPGVPRCRRHGFYNNKPTCGLQREWRSLPTFVAVVTVIITVTVW